MHGAGRACGGGRGGGELGGRAAPARAEPRLPAAPRPHSPRVRQTRLERHAVRCPRRRPPLSLRPPAASRRARARACASRLREGAARGSSSGSCCGCGCESCAAAPLRCSATRRARDFAGVALGCRCASARGGARGGARAAASAVARGVAFASESASPPARPARPLPQPVGSSRVVRLQTRRRARAARPQHDPKDGLPASPRALAPVPALGHVAAPNLATAAGALAQTACCGASRIRARDLCSRPQQTCVLRRPCHLLRPRQGPLRVS